MNWIVLLVGLALLIVLFFLKKSGQVSVEDARRYLQNGATVVDVRTPGEFSGGHLAGAKNVPLDEIETTLPKLVRDKEQVLLLHCASGMRSGLAVQKLKAMGYAHACNLGSYSRAKEIIGD